MTTAHDLIRYLGGTTTVAKLSGVSPPSVSEWARRNHIPERRLKRLAELTGRRGDKAFISDLEPANWHRIWPGLVNAGTAEEAA